MVEPGPSAQRRRTVQPASMKHYDRVKRVLDVALGGVALVLSAPLQAVIAVLVRRKLGSPILFRQERPGKDEKIFELVKFRTMKEPDPASGLVTDADRMTPFGSRLRSTSLDELPTLWNVVKGDMSLVGPRPLLVQYLPLYSAEQRRRHEVRPGLTGLAQVKGRNQVAWSDRLALDVEYVDRRSLRLDLSLMLATILPLLRRTGIADDGHVTKEFFTGEAANPTEVSTGD